MRIDELPEHYFSYKFATRPMDEGRWIPVSGPRFPEDNTWVTIPWDQHIVVPDDPAADAPALGGWTFLYGPCVFSMTAAIGVGDVQPHASVHFQPWASDETDGGLVASWEGWEWGVLEKEGNTCHFTGAWHGVLAAGQRLRLRIDYWHATHGARFNRAHVEGTYRRLSA